MRDYRDLDVWRRAIDLAVAAIETADGIPTRHQFGLAERIRRAAASIPANIAEGAGRQGSVQLARYLQIALASACELDSHLALAGRLNLIHAAASEPLLGRLLELSRMLGEFIRSLRGRRPQ
jgi:four helix bundle protein